MPKVKDFKPCGTSAAYRRHKRNNETPCDACKEAEQERTNAYRRANRDRIMRRRRELEAMQRETSSTVRGLFTDTKECVVCHEAEFMTSIGLTATATADRLGFQYRDLARHLDAHYSPTATMFNSKQQKILNKENQDLRTAMLQGAEA